MSTIVEATLPADQFALAETHRRFPDVEFETVRTAASSSEQVVPFLRAGTDGDRDADVSHQALSERFRRGHSALVENVLSRQSV